MAINLLDLMQNAVGNKVVGQVAGLLGVDEGVATKMVGGALPTLLAGFIGKASTDEGAEQLGAVLDQADGTILDNIGAILGGADGGSARLEEMGSGLIGGLFGDKVEGVLDILSGLGGLDKGKSGSLLGIITPIIFSLLGKQKKGLGLDAAGFAKLLFSQKDLLKGVLPPGLGGVLGLADFDEGGVSGEVKAAAATAAGAVAATAAGVTDAAGSAVDAVADTAGDVKDAAADAVGAAADKVGDVAGSAVDAASDAVGGVKDAASSVADAAADKVADAKDAAASAVDAAADKVDAAKDAASSAVDSAADTVADVRSAAGNAANSVAETAEKTAEAAVKTGGGLMKVLIPLILLGVIGFCVWKFVLSGGAAGVGGETGGIAVPGVPEVPAVTAITGDNALATMTGVFKKANKTLRGIKDVDSAKAAVPEIEEITNSVGAVGKVLGSVPAPAKEQIKKAIVDFAPKFQGMAEKAMAIPGVQPIIEPKLNELVNQLDGFGG